MMSIGSIEELKEKSDNCPDNIELHRPYVDAVTCKCPKCQGTMKRFQKLSTAGSIQVQCHLHSTTIH